jgi:hypothetical protein
MQPIGQIKRLLLLIHAGGVFGVIAHDGIARFPYFHHVLSTVGLWTFLAKAASCSLATTYLLGLSLQCSQLKGWKWVVRVAYAVALFLGFGFLLLGAVQ